MKSPAHHSRALFFLAATATLLAFSGCASLSKIVKEKTTVQVGRWYSVVTNSSPFYRYGPQQGYGADQLLAKDSLMQLVRPSFGYCKVRLQNGQEGYVAAEDIRPASADAVAKALAPPVPPSPIGRNQPTGERFHFNSNDPRLIAPPEPLPAPSATPEFRY
jgi:hypothetical protein